MSQELLIDVHDNVMWLTINRPERRNAITVSVLKALTEAIDDANRRRELRAIVLTGSGNQAFCAGADLRHDPAFRFDYSEPHSHSANLFRRARASTLPLIARVNGACVASGMGLLAMCDMAVASDKATFALPEVRVGLFPAQVLTVLQHLIGRRKLAELCITGDAIPAEEALQIGLVNTVAADFDRALDALLARVRDKSPAAIRRGLYLMKHIQHMSFEESMAFTESQIGLFALTDDAREGQEALAEQRKPRFTGH